MRKDRARKLLALLLLIVSPLRAAANGFGLASQDAFATGRGEAFAATADNPSAIFYNPAGITQLEGQNFRAGIYGIYLNQSFVPPTNAPNHKTTYYNQDQYAGVPQFFYAYSPKDLPVSFGLGIYAPFGGNTTWSQNTGFRAVALNGSLTYVTINPVFAVQVSPDLSFAAGAMVNYGDITMEQGLLPYQYPFTNYFRFTGHGWSAGYNIGVLWRPYEKLRVGLNFRSSATVRMEGRTEFEQEPLPGLYPGTNRSAYADFKFPLTAVAGISYRPTPRWNLEFDANYTDWSSFGTVNIHQKNPPFPMQPITPVTLDWQESWMLEAGVTRYIGKYWHASAGYVFNQNSVPDAYYSPLVSDMDRHFFSVGLGMKARHIELDLAYQFGYGPTRTVTGSQPSSTPGLNAGQNADGKYEFFSSALMVTAGVHF